MIDMSLKKVSFVVLGMILVCLGYIASIHYSKSQENGSLIKSGMTTHLTQKEALAQKAVDLKRSLDDLGTIYENGKKYGQLKKTYEDLKPRYKSKHPKMVEIIGQLESLTSDSQKMDVVSKEIEQTKVEYSIALERYEDFLKKGVQSAPEAQSLSTIVWKTLGIGFLFLILGLGVFSIVDRRIYHPKQLLKVQKHLPLLAVTPKLTRGDQRFSLHLHRTPTSHYSKSILFIRNRLLSLPTPPKIMGVASVGQSQSSVSLVSNLAISLAQAQKKILLMDCQFHTPRQHRYFKLPNRGVGELLQGDTTVAPFNVEVPGLKVLPAGEGFGLKALRSAQFLELLKYFKESYEFILIDAPAFSLESEASWMAQATDGIVLTVPRGQITQETLRWAKAEVDRYQIQLLGIVLKDAPVFKAHGWNQFLSSQGEGRA